MAEPTLQHGDQVGSYRIIRLLGQGGMGAVYEAMNDAIERRVALKLLHADQLVDPIMVTRFFNEARASNRIDHPSIVQVFDFGHQPGGAAYLVMELLRGESLAVRLASLQRGQKRIPVPQVLQIGWQIADALTVAHDRGIVHRDLKPDNLMLVAEPVAPSGERVKILDFGIAKLTDAALGPRGRTNTAAVFGTPLYMSPEQCSGAGAVDAKTDVYALGVILFEMLAGRPPFDAEGSGELIGSHLFKPPPLLAQLVPELPERLASLADQLLLKDKELRPSMREVRDLLARLRLDLQPQADPATTAATRRSLEGEADVAAAGVAWSKAAKLTQGLRPMPRARIWRGVTALLLCAVLGSLGPALLARRGSQRPAPADGRATLVNRAAVAVPVPPPAGSTPSVSPLALEAAPQPAQPRWTVRSTPPGAGILDARGVVVGQTPWQSIAVECTGTYRVRIRRPGFVERSVDLPCAEEKSVELVLSPQRQTVPAKRAGAPAASGLRIDLEP